MLSRKVLLIVAGLVVVLIAAGGAGLWYFFLRDDAPQAVTLDAALTAVPGASGTSAKLSDLTGTWSVQSGPSFAGYRVNENLVTFGSKTAVGRTTSLQGSLTYDGKTISGVKVSADLSQLKSDQDLRDSTIRMSSLESCKFPTATFELSTPIALDSAVTNGGAVSKTVQGNLTLHGVTKPVSIDVKGQLQNGQVVIVGSTDIKFADYNISQPRSLFVVSLDDHGTMEFQLIFAKGAAATSTPLANATPAGCSGGGFGPPPGGTPPAGGFPGGPGGGGQGGPPGGGFPPINTPAPVPSPVG